MKILIVDDSAFMRNMIKNILKEKNFEIVEAATGEEGVEMFQKSKPDLVFMDIILPGKSGIQALQEIKSIDSGAKVVMCTSVGGQQNIINESVEAGATDFVVKPFKPDDINKVISSFEKK